MNPTNISLLGVEISLHWSESFVYSLVVGLNLTCFRVCGWCWKNQSEHITLSIWVVKSRWCFCAANYCCLLLLVLGSQLVCHCLTNVLMEKYYINLLKYTRFLLRQHVCFPLLHLCPDVLLPFSTCVIGVYVYVL